MKYFVSFWKNGREMTMWDELDTREYAYDWAREGLRDDKNYDEACIYRGKSEESAEWYDTVTR